MLVMLVMCFTAKKKEYIGRIFFSRLERHDEHDEHDEAV
jgi:hypothetical protein